MKSSVWFRPLASSSALLAGIGALVVAGPLTAPGTGIARSVTSPAYELLSYDANEADGNNDVHTDGTHVEDDVHTNGTHVEDVHTNGTHVEDDVHTNGTHVEDSTGTHVDAAASRTGTHVVEICDGSNASVTSFATGLLTQSQTPAQPRVLRTTRGTTAGSLTSGSSTTSPAVSVAVTGNSVRSAESESTGSATRTPGSVSAQNNETSTRSKVRSTRTSAAR